MARFPIQVLESRITNLRFAVFGGGGVVFDQFEWEGLTDNGEVIRPRRRSHVDGQGISFLRAIGLQVALATSADAAVRSLVERWNGLSSCKSGAWKSVCVVPPSELEHWLCDRGGTFDECVVMGAEFAHWKMLEPAGVRVAAGDATPEIKERCDFVAARPGGSGAVRDFADYVLKVRRVDPFSLSTS